MVIDAGQKRVAGESEMCKECRFLYAEGDADEEKLHHAAHKKYLGVVSFAGGTGFNSIQPLIWISRFDSIKFRGLCQHRSNSVGEYSDFKA